MCLMQGLYYILTSTPSGEREKGAKCYKTTSRWNPLALNSSTCTCTTVFIGAHIWVIGKLIGNRENSIMLLWRFVNLDH